VNSWGAAIESDWPYREEKFAIRPPKVAWDSARLHKALKYARVSINTAQCKAVLNSGFPVVMGFMVYEDFMGEEVALTGNVRVPTRGEVSIGGHAVLMVGYSDVSWVDLVTGKVMQPGFIFRNSWSRDWGCSGYGILPYSYIIPNLVEDFWQINAVS